MGLTRAYEGTATATGAVPVRFYGLPAHLQSDEYNPRVNHVLAEDMEEKSMTVTLGGGAATVVFEGCNADPATAANWFDIGGGGVSADGIVTSTDQCRFVRANVSAYTSGTITVGINLGA